MERCLLALLTSTPTPTLTPDPFALFIPKGGRSKKGWGISFYFKGAKGTPLPDTAPFLTRTLILLTVPKKNERGIALFTLFIVLFSPLVGAKG